MSDTNETVPPVVPAPVVPVKTDAQIIAESPFATPLQVTRNGVTATFENFVGMRGDWKGKPYPAFQISAAKVDPSKDAIADLTSDSNFLAGLTFFGKENIVRILNVHSKRLGQDLVEDSIPESGPNAGVIQLPVLIQGWEKFEASVIKLSDLMDQYNSAVAAMNAALPQFIKDMSDPSTDKTAVGAAFQKLSDNVNALKGEYDIRKSKRSKEAAVSEVAPT